MSTRSSARNLFPPLDNLELTIQRRSRANPTLLNNFEMAAEGNSDLPVPDLRTMKELCQLSLNGRGRPIAPIDIQAMNFGLNNDMIQQSIKVNGVTDDALRLYVFPHSLTHHATASFDRLPRISINTFEQMAKMFLGKYFPPYLVTKLRNEITNFCQSPDESLFEAWERYKLSIDRCPNHNMFPVTQIDTFYNGLTLRHRDTINAAAGETFMKRRPEECYDLIENMTAHHNDWDTSAQQSESSSSITSSSNMEIATLKAEMAKINQNLMRVLQVNQQVKAVTPNCETCSGPHSYSDCPATVGQTQNVYAARAYQAYQAPAYQALSYQASVHQPPIPQPQVVTTNEFTNFMKANDAILKNMQTNMTSFTNSNLELKNMFGQFMKMNTASSSGSRTLPGNTITNPKEELKGITTRSGTTYQGPTIPTTSSSLPPVVERETEPDHQNFVDKQNKLSELARTSLNEHCSAVLLKKLPEKLGDPGKFLIPCDFLRMAECLALTDLGASINLMPLLVWNKISVSELSPTCMTLELANRLISHVVGVAKDVFIKVGTFHFPTDFVIVDFNADPLVPLILRRYFLKTRRALIDVFEGELTLRVGKEAITFNLDQTSRYSANYNDMPANQIDVIDMACEEYSQEVLGSFDVIASSNPTPYYDPIVSTTSLTLTSFGDSDFLLEEVDAFLDLEDDPTSPKVDQTYVDTQGDILLLEAFLNDDPSLPHLNQEITCLKFERNLKFVKLKLINLQLMSLLRLNLRTYLPISNTYFQKATIIQHKRRVNPKIHDVIKKEVLKLLDAELIYPISDSPWVSPVYCVPKKGGFTVVENEENELILTRLVTRWRFRIDYRKLNEATRKDHFSLPFIDQMLERLAGNEYYCFLDCFSGYFQIPIDPKDQEKTTFTCSYGTFAYQKILKRCEDTNLCLNWEKSHFMVKEGIVIGHKISKNRIEVDKAKVNVIAKLPHPTTVKGICSFLGHASFYRQFIQDFLKIPRPMTRLLEKDTIFFFFKECVEAFQTLKRKLTEAPILISLDWDLPFELMCDVSDFAIAVDYLLKWVEAKAPPTNDARFVCKFLKSLFARFGTPCAIISDHETHFCNDQFAKVMLNYGVTHCLATAYHPQTSGQVEVSNRGLKRILERTEKTKRLHDSEIKDSVFNIGDRVLLFNSRLKIFSGKLKTRWSGPFTITHVFPYGTVELSQTDRPNFKVNGHRLKHYFEEDIPKMVVPDLQPFPKDQ
nr:reverse transcriptase domain-containing protein [Tanacetum cinerariifolium]